MGRRHEPRTKVQKSAEDLYNRRLRLADARPRIGMTGVLDVSIACRGRSKDGVIRAVVSTWHRKLPTIYVYFRLGPSAFVDSFEVKLQN